MGYTAICFQFSFICTWTLCSGGMEWMNERASGWSIIWKKLIWYYSSCSGMLNQDVCHNRSITFGFYKETQWSWQQVMCNTKLASAALGPRLLSKPLLSAKPQGRGNKNPPERSACTLPIPANLQTCFAGVSLLVRKCRLNYGQVKAYALRIFRK